MPRHIFGPETHITAVVPLALGIAKLEDFPEFDDPHRINNANQQPPRKKSKPTSPEGTTTAAEDETMKDAADDNDNVDDGDKKPRPTLRPQVADHEADHNVENFTAMTRCVVYGLQHRAVQGMLDFDFMCKRQKTSVAAMIFPFAANHFVKFYWGTNEIMMPVYQSMKEAFEKHPEVSVCVNFASFRSVYGKSILEKATTAQKATSSAA
jgi:ATP citrate (pro-S)-lyase